MRALVWLGYIWAFPNTISGMLLACLSRPCFPGRQPRRCRPLPPALEVVARGGLLGWLLGCTGHVAITLGAVIVYVVPAPTQRLRRHEHRHVLQQLLLGPLFFPVYLACSAWALLRGGHLYTDNALERDARAQE